LKGPGFEVYFSILDKQTHTHFNHSFRLTVKGKGNRKAVNTKYYYPLTAIREYKRESD